MTKQYTFLQLAHDVLNATRKPMSAEQMWLKANEMGLAEKVGSKGKTPEISIQALLYVDIRDNKGTKFQQVSKRPVLFGLKSQQYDIGEIDNAAGEIESDDSGPSNQSSKKSWVERDLHPLVATYVRSSQHFKCQAKTIYHEKAQKGKQGSEHWSYPDMVGVYYPFQDYELETLWLYDTLRVSPFILYSFEIKQELKTSNLRESFFQAVSNSSWANEGYLVAPIISSDSDFLEDLQRLSNAFGIGVIKLDIAHAEQSEILFQARTREDLDWQTVDRLVNKSSDFKSFLDAISKSSKIQDITGEYEEILLGDQYDSYLKKHSMASE